LSDKSNYTEKVLKLKNNALRLFSWTVLIESQVIEGGILYAFWTMSFLVSMFWWSNSNNGKHVIYLVWYI